MNFGRLGVLVAAWSLLGATIARAEPEAGAAPIRGDRPILVGLSLSGPWMAGHDVTLPLPSARVGVNVSPHLALDLTAGTLSHDVGGRWTTFDVGARWFFADGPLGPYALARVGAFFNEPDEGEGARLTYPLAAVGGGLEYTCRCGFAAWAEAGPALFRYTDGKAHSADGGVYMSLGAGYRIPIR